MLSALSGGRTPRPLRLRCHLAIQALILPHNPIEAEILEHARPGGVSQLPAPLRPHFKQTVNAGGEGFGLSRGHDDARLAHNCRRVAHIGHHARDAAGHGLAQDKGKCLAVGRAETGNVQRGGDPRMSSLRPSK